MSRSEITETNPSAFPSPYFVNLNEEHPTLLRGAIECTDGMSLRDWFAGMALASAKFNASESVFDGEAKVSYCDTLAECCYKMADAMLRAREGK